MKRLLITLFVLGLAGQGFAQDATAPAAPAPAAPAAPATPAAPNDGANTAPVPALPNGWQGLLDLVNNPGPTFSYLGNDLKKNTGFKIESTIPFLGFNWKQGTATAGDTIPFFHEGSYLYTGFAFGKNLNNGTLKVQNVEFSEGVRLNAFTRPCIRWILNQATFHQLEKSTVLDAVANGNSIGINAGHNWAGPDGKTIINDYSGYVGFEVVFGGNPNTPSAQAAKRTRKVWLR